MGDYYNTTRGPLSVTLNDGSSCAVSPKSWIYVAPGNENSASISKLVQKGYLVKAAVARTVPAAAPVVAPTPAPVPAKVEAPVEKAFSFSTGSTSSMKEEIIRKKR